MSTELTTAEVVAWLMAVTAEMFHDPQQIRVKLANINRDVQEGIVPLITTDDYNAAFRM